MFLSRTMTALMALLLAVGAVNHAGADDAPDEQTQGRYASFEKLLTGVRLTGSFTVDGKENGTPRAESYEIRSVKKSSKGDFWLFTARVKYGDKDQTLPMPLEVKWAGDTPVITLTDMEIPGLGTFSSRVVFHDGKYAGTWRHGEVSGHLFGVIEPAEPGSPEKP